MKIKVVSVSKTGGTQRKKNIPAGGVSQLPALLVVVGGKERTEPVDAEARAAQEDSFVAVAVPFVIDPSGLFVGARLPIGTGGEVWCVVWCVKGWVARHSETTKSTHRDDWVA